MLWLKLTHVSKGATGVYIFDVAVDCLMMEIQ